MNALAMFLASEPLAVINSFILTSNKHRVAPLSLAIVIYPVSIVTTLKTAIKFGYTGGMCVTFVLVYKCRPRPCRLLSFHIPRYSSLLT